MADLNPLSDREIEILKLVAEGQTNRAIAQQLTISPNTVKVHLSNIFEKTGVASRTEATLYAIEHRIVDVPGGEDTTDSAPATPAEPLPRRRRWLWLILGVLMVAAIAVLTVVLSRPAEPEPQPAAEPAQRWQERAPMPEARIGMAAVTYDGNIYTIAGEGPDGITGSVFRYLQETDVWEALTDKPTPVTDVEGVVIGEKVYVPGGLGLDGKPTASLDIFDPRLNSWSEGAPLPDPISDYALAELEGKLYLFGGWDGAQALATVWVYSPTEDAWQSGAGLDFPRQAAEAVALTDRIVLLGGRDGEQLFATCQSYFPARDEQGEDPWESFVDLPEGRAGFSAASIYDSIYVLGGETAAQAESGLIITEDTWLPLPANQDYAGRQTEMISLGAELVVLNPQEAEQPTEAWIYQAFYYSIYIPFVP